MVETRVADASAGIAAAGQRYESSEWADAAGVVAVPELRCAGCRRRSLLMDQATGTAVCAQGECSVAAMDGAVSWLLVEAGIDHDPVGGERSVHGRGRPVSFEGQRRPRQGMGR
ncbi:hypothetical protein OG225_40910 (plasmid) [Nocardia sp. NBC_01377]